jgi:hypothetical protein
LLCLTCNRVRPARSPVEYTVLRARWITIYGLCTCPHPATWQADAHGDAAVAANPRENAG